MKTTMNSTQRSVPLLGLLLLGLSQAALAQRPQDNWYLEQIWTKGAPALGPTNGGLSVPYGIAIGPDRRIYVGDQGYGQIQVYLPDGTFSFSITNGFGGGESFSQPRGMITDDAGNLYVADAGRHRVFVFDANGNFIRTVGTATGSDDGQLSGPIDVAVGPNNEVFVLESGNSRVSVFGTGGEFKRKWGSAGLLAGQLYSPLSIAVSRDGRVYICQHDYWYPDRQQTNMKGFDINGIWVSTVSTFATGHGGDGDYFHMGGASVRLDPGGFPHVAISFFHQIGYGNQVGSDYRPICRVWTRDCSASFDYRIDGANAGQGRDTDLRSPGHAIGPDGTTIFCSRGLASLIVYRMTYRDQCSVPRNAIPIPAVWGVKQRANSPLVDIDYEVTDADDTNVHTALLIFTNASSTMLLGNCLRYPTLMEGTATNVGPGIAANQVHRLTWNAGADWSVNLGDCRISVLARDSRTNLLDIHYLALPADRGMPAVTISRSPLTADDFMQVWWWLLATGDPGITLASNQVYGVSGIFDGKQLCNNGSTTADGRAYIYEKMHVREATPGEVQWAKQGTMPSGSSPNQWTDATSRPRQVGGRPNAVNEWGFDTGSWDTNTCKWVVPLN